MKSNNRLVLLLSATILLIGIVVLISRNTKKTSIAASGTPRTADGKPDFSGYWGRLKIDAPPQTEPIGSEEIDGGVDGFSKYITAYEKDAQIERRHQSNRPIYKPEYWGKIRAVDWNFSRKYDPDSHCLPGVPRLGVPKKITQLPNEMDFFYEEESNIFRVIPTDDRPHNTVKVALPSWLGDSVAHWEGDTLVVDTIGLIDQGWLGPTGYVHSADTHVTERLHREGNKLILERIVEDPMLLQPWHMDTVSAQLNTNPQAALWDEICSEKDEVFEGDPYEGR